MPLPAQPPEIPAIIQPVTSEDAVSPEESSKFISPWATTQTRTTRGLATPTPPDTLPPESSSLIPPQNAAVLGTPISVGYKQPERPPVTPEVPVSNNDLSPTTQDKNPPPPPPPTPP
ncbi:MAG TPA: hypothetical protein DDZ80_30365, partial [Cyanobacteria bacterium UBA8803]|nr:hypothetical protein [Cyanobacteria bacterium UBA8803]